MNKIIIGLTTLLGMLLPATALGQNRDLNPVKYAHQLSWHDGYFFAMGRGAFYASTDGGNWQAYSLPERTDVWDIVRKQDTWFVMTETQVYAGAELDDLTPLQSDLVGATDLMLQEQHIIAAKWDGVYTTCDGITWTRQSDARTKRLARGNGLVVAVGDDVATSSDGVVFSKQFLGAHHHSVAFGADRFVIGGENFIYHSSDGINWSKSELGPQAQFSYYSGLLYDGDRFHYIDNSAHAVSEDGIAWEFIQEPGQPDQQLTHAATSPERMLLLYQNHTLYTREPDASWSRRSMGQPQIIDINVFDNKLVIVDPQEVLVTSDGDHFFHFQRPTNWSSNIVGVCVEGEELLVYGSGVAVSSDGVNWTETFNGGKLNSLVYDGSQYIGVGEWGLLITSPDGITWTQHQVTTSDLIQVASNGRATLINPPLRTTNGTDWESFSVDGRDIYAMVAGNGIILVMTEQALFSTVDGRRFQAAGQPGGHRQLRFKTGYFWRGHSFYDGLNWVWDWYFSKDGHDWTTFLTNTTRNQIFVLWQDRMVHANNSNISLVEAPIPDTTLAHAAVIPWVVDNETWHSRIVLTNRDQEPVDIRMTASPEQGNQVIRTQTLEPGQVFTNESAELFPGLTRYSLLVEAASNQVLTSFLTYADTGAEVLAPSQTFGVPEADLNNELIFPYVPGNEVSALVLSAPRLPLDQSSGVIFTLHGTSGETLAQTSARLLGPRPLAILLRDLFPGMTLPDDAAVTVRGDHPIAGVTFVFNQEGQPSMAAAFSPVGSGLED